MKKLVLLVLALVLSACSALGGGSELDRSRAVWERAGIQDYRFNLHIGCFCVFTDLMPLTVEVRGGEVVSMTYADGTPVTADDPQREFFMRFATIDSLFAELASGESSKADKVEVTYDPTRGFPATMYVDQIELAADDEYSVEISNFEPLQ